MIPHGLDDAAFPALNRRLGHVHPVGDLLERQAQLRRRNVSDVSSGSGAG